MTSSKRKATDSPPISATDNDQAALDLEPSADAPVEAAQPEHKRANLFASSSDLLELPLEVLEPLLPLQKQQCLNTLVGKLPPIPTEPAPPIASTSTLTSAEDDDAAVFDNPPSRSTADDKTRLQAAACVGLEEEWHTLHGMLHSSVTAQESNSCLLIGASGSGKSLLVDSVLDSICKKDPLADSKSYSKPYYHVHLAGTVQINDRSAMKEMAQQLILQGAFTEEDVGEAIDAPSLMDDDDTTPAPDATAGADHVFGGDADDEDEDEAAHAAAAAAEEQAEIQDELAGAILSSLNNIIANIIALLSNTASASATNSSTAAGGGRKPLIITLDDFDLFTARPRQAMLYCLLDAVQAASYGAGLAVVGLTSRVDTVDLLEKRVKSRFSHRILHVRPPGSFDVFERIVRNALSPAPFNTDSSLSSIPTAHKQSFTQAWQHDIDALFTHPHVRDVLRGIYELSNDIRMVYRILTPTLCKLSLLDPSLDVTMLLETAAVEVGDGTIHILRDLTEPEMALLIAVKHLQTRDRQVFNFEMCFDELTRFAARDARERQAASSTTTALAAADSAAVGEAGGAGLSGSAVATPFFADRKIALMSFLALLSLELILPENSVASLSIANPVAKPSAAASAGTGRTNQATIRKEFWKVRCVLTPHTIVNAVKDRLRPIAISSSLVKWASSHG
ncbi:hypothetical protein EX895_000961 [Sporisorium graminicola]|uniref:Uncharacterized protein n=1 Tax=Sporisorium graminicola TaxID=280036 RepID=A0A4U7L1B3_9BASI|nr:hypothetical protein EX895_000961 [Sporisorium graminicola]TKY90963.1 hypothetical protein EX895_000961 [Sporisorium graminicola]